MVHNEKKIRRDLSEVENKGIGDYIILNIFKDEAQMKSGMDWNATANKVYKEKCLDNTKENEFLMHLEKILELIPLKIFIILSQDR